MPIYEYGCSTCGVVFEKRQSFTDPPVEVYANCPNNQVGCQISRLLSTPAIVFKGSGFYVTDNRGANSAGTPADKTEKSETKSESKPETASTGSDTSSDK
ncbi:MAG TPA: FmdB family zinc ribbon protein [Anaerolineae bacterium]|jgi:putative FmdB family regulatory protein